MFQRFAGKSVREEEKGCREGSKVVSQLESKECAPAAVPGTAWCLEADTLLVLGLGLHFVGLG